MKKIFIYWVGCMLLCVSIGLAACGGSVKKNADDSCCVHIETPERPAGQQDEIGRASCRERVYVLV